MLVAILIIRRSTNFLARPSDPREQVVYQLPTALRLFEIAHATLEGSLDEQLASALTHMEWVKSLEAPAAE